MRLRPNRIEKPVIGYIAIALALLAGMIAVSAFGQPANHSIVSVVPAIQTRSQSSVVGPSPLQPNRWILGVRADATSAGYVIRHVEPHSAASKIGLEAGDRIVAINGQQIGFVEHDLIRLSESLAQFSNQNGQVRLLIQNRRNRRLLTIRVTMQHPKNLLGN